MGRRGRGVAVLAAVVAASAAVPIGTAGADKDEPAVGVGVPRLRPIEELAAGPSTPYPWKKRFKAAVDYARARRGRVAIAVVDENGNLRAFRGRQAFRSASVVKAMLLVAYLDSGAVRNRALRQGDRRLLGPMITRSDNGAATRVRSFVGSAGLRNVATRAGMRDFVPTPAWGSSRITASDQAGFFARIDRLVVARHRAYARNLLSHVIPQQRWGIPRALPAGWRIFFKGGWLTGLVHQVALLEHRSLRISVAVLTDGDPSHSYGAETLRGVARRLFRGLERY